MGTFYRNATVAIGAFSYEYAGKGMLRPRHAENYRLVLCKISNQTLDRHMPKMYQRQEGVPTNQKAWQTQELYLSRRTIT